METVVLNQLNEWLVRSVNTKDLHNPNGKHFCMETVVV